MHKKQKIHRYSYRTTEDAIDVSTCQPLQLRETLVELGPLDTYGAWLRVSA